MHELLEIAIIIISAKMAGEIAERAKQPPILGQIVVGIVLGPSILGIVLYDDLVRIFSDFGIIFLIFLVGLQTRPAEIRRVGFASSLLATGGVIVPVVGGLLLAPVLGFHWQEAMILGTSLCATSVAVTAGVLMDLGKIRTKIADTILAGAVIDDVLGLLILTFVVAILGGQSTPGSAMRIVYAVVFWAVIFPIGWKIIPRLAELVGRMKTEGAFFVMVLGILFVFAYAAETAGLASIIGAFLVGMLLAEAKGSSRIISSTLPIYYFLAPVFFVSIGLLFDLSVILAAPLVVAVVSLVAILGKVLGCGAGTRLAGYSAKASLFAGFAMVPRGEVALIIAGFARTFESASGNALLGSELFSMIAGMSIFTILVTPVVLRVLTIRWGQAIQQ